jgi:hypothetical protein
VLVFWGNTTLYSLFACLWSESMRPHVNVKLVDPSSSETLPHLIGVCTQILFH